MSKTKTQTPMRSRRAKHTSLFIKAALIALLLAALYLYGALTRHTGHDVYSEGTLRTQDAAVVHFIDVGQGDAACIVTPDGHAALIDAGSNASEPQLISYLSKYRIKTLDYAIFTHPHEDHIGGADRVFAQYDVAHVLLSDDAEPTASYEHLLHAIDAEGCDVSLACPGQTYALGDGTLTILGPADTAAFDGNNASILVRFDFGNTSFLFTGDAEEEAEAAALARSPDALDADVLKVGHHGSSTSSTEPFLRSVTPSVAVISCGAYNDYGHPHSAVTDRLAAHTPHIFRTDTNGSIRIYTDGTALLVQSDKKTDDN